MTEIFNNYFNVGQSLNNLEIIHSENLKMTQLFEKHSNLDKINFTLTSEEITNSMTNENNKEEKEKEKENEMIKNINFKYDFPLKKWKSINLTNYPINDSLITTSSKCKNSLKILKLNNSVNISKNPIDDLNKIILEINNK